MDVPPILVSIIDRIDNPLRKRKLSNKDALEQLCFLLKTGVPWRHIPLKGCSSSAVYKRYRHWLSLDVFDKAWVELTSLYAQSRLKTNPSWFHDLFIDTTMIKNVGGVDGLGKNPTDRGRLATKMGVVVDNAAIPIALQFFEANRNDVTTTMPTVEQIPCALRKDRRYKHALIGDKGYISKDVADALKRISMRLVTPRKTNSRMKPNTKKDEQRLQRRHKVENLFCRLDKFKKIHCRHEKSLKSFKALTIFGMMFLIATSTVPF